jgi:hypothetical protein
VGARFDESMNTYEVDAAIRFRLHVREPDRLSVDVYVAGDMFMVVANGAELHLEPQDAGNDPIKWVELCDSTFAALVSQDLRIRIRRTLLGRRRGAIWIPLGEGGWNGELFAFAGIGREQRFVNWLHQG